MLYRKIEDFKAERDQLNTELESLTSGEMRSNGKDDKEIDQAIAALKSFGKALAKARPEEIKELLSSIVSKIELNFEHKPISRRRNVLTSGTIYLRPDAANVPIMNTTGSEEAVDHVLLHDNDQEFVFRQKPSGLLRQERATQEACREVNLEADFRGGVMLCAGYEVNQAVRRLADRQVTPGLGRTVAHQET